MRSEKYAEKESQLHWLVILVISSILQACCSDRESIAHDRFHDISEFDEAKRSCRRRLAGHNERRRKSSSDFPGEGGSN